ncbi:PadR family transcriptional regulator [Liberiplasma polymorphum]|uniref:PadR family transcriptional regulator n=1 Tax=Liberiplasma polymorphum TaxID=3374570 RepID=UPI0037737BA5
MITSSEFIKGYTEIIILAILSKNDAYLYEITRTIKTVSDGQITISNPSVFTMLKHLVEEGEIEIYQDEEHVKSNKKMYRLTEYGKLVLSKQRVEYIASLYHLIALINQ